MGMGEGSRHRGDKGEEGKDSKTNFPFTQFKTEITRSIEKKTSLKPENKVFVFFLSLCFIIFLTLLEAWLWFIMLCFLGAQLTAVGRKIETEVSVFEKISVCLNCGG